MGGSAGGNAQIMSLVGPSVRDGARTGQGQLLNATHGNTLASALQNSFDAYMRNSMEGGGFQGVLGLPELPVKAPAGHHGGGGGGNPSTGGEDPGTGGDGSGDGNPTPTYWQFPHYTQTWAFTPPTPTPWMAPQPFDPKKYGSPFSKKNR